VCQCDWSVYRRQMAFIAIYNRPWITVSPILIESRSLLPLGHIFNNSPIRRTFIRTPTLNKIVGNSKLTINKRKKVVFPISSYFESPSSKCVMSL
jgi:hypothetical protein